MIINGREIGTQVPPYIVIEIGAGWQHFDPLGSCISLMKAAKDAGADAVKIQLYRPEDLVPDRLPPGVEEKLLAGSPWAGATLKEIYEKGSLPEDIVPGLFEAARGMGITLFSSVFSPRVIPMLESLRCPAYKIGSAEFNYDELLWAVSATNKPAIVSTGMSSLDEVLQAWAAFNECAFLHCAAQYPADAGAAELSRISRLKAHVDSELVGLSDHTRGSAAAIIAVALGATIVEKHVALPMTLDAGFALRTYELAPFVESVREAWNALQAPRGSHSAPASSMTGLKRSVRATRDIAQGEVLTRENVAVLRPAGGARPQSLHLLLGAHAGRDFKMGDGVD